MYFTVLQAGVVYTSNRPGGPSAAVNLEHPANKNMKKTEK